MAISLETYNHDGRLYRHPKANQPRWSSYDSEEGSGFGSLTWREDREVGRDYADLGYYYPVKVRKGLRKILFHGFIVDIEEVQGDQEYLVITALGWSSVFSNDVFNKVYRDARPGEWTGYEEASGAFCPDKFDYDKNEQLYFEPRRSVDFLSQDHTYLQYTFEFGEAPVSISFDYDVALPYSWPGQLAIRDNVGGLLWSKTATATGSETLSISAGAMHIWLAFYCTAAGENTAESGTVYGKLTNVKVCSHSSTTVTIGDVLADVVTLLEDHGISSDVTKIESVGKDLPATVAFETDKKPIDAMQWCAQFQSTNGKPLRWGIEMNDLARVFLAEQDLTTVRYYVRRSSGLNAQVKGSARKAAQKLYGIYKDDDNEVQRTSVETDDDQIASFGGRFRKEAINISGNVDATAAAELMEYALADRSAPQVTTSFEVTDFVYSATGKKVPVEDIQAGGIVVVADFRGREATQSADDYRTQWSSFYLVGVEIDYERRSARLIPAGDRREFDRMMTDLAAYSADA